jgi:(E)-4-hydroxy-3-methylbut-2-enyl-diphosphate synthase
MSFPAPRRKSRPIKVGWVPVGGDAPIAVQSMATTDTRDVEATVQQIRTLQATGCDIARVAVPDLAAAKVLQQIKQGIGIPLVADIHFDYRLALEAVRQGVDCIRYNPGNIGARDRVATLADACRDKGIPIRIGVNAGSLEKDLLRRHGGPTAEALVESALRHVACLEAVSFHDVKISVKAADVPTMVEAYRGLAARCDYPLHLGVTEAGTMLPGTVKSSAGIGVLLGEGIGDTIRVSLAADPVEEVKVGLALLKALGLRKGGLNLVACPSCGRSRVDVFGVAARVEERLRHVKADVHVAVMGCEVNGPGEAREADVGIAGGPGYYLLFRKGQIVGKVAQDAAEDTLVAEALRIALGETDQKQSAEAAR